MAIIVGSPSVTIFFTLVNNESLLHIENGVNNTECGSTTVDDPEAGGE